MSLTSLIPSPLLLQQAPLIAALVLLLGFMFLMGLVAAVVFFVVLGLASGRTGKRHEFWLPIHVGTPDEVWLDLSSGSDSPREQSSHVSSAGRHHPSGPVDHEQATGLRAAAALIDSLLLFFVYVPVTLVVAGIVPEEHLGWAVLLPGLLLPIAYHTLLEGLTGRTVGKLLVGVRVVNARTACRLGLGRALARNLLRPIDGLFFYTVGWCVAMCNASRRRIGDLLAGTAVVRSIPRAPYFSEADQAKVRAGVTAEGRVREALLPLASYGYHVFTGLKDRSFGDIDNLLVGPGGIFVVETKSHRCEVALDPYSGKLLRDGEPFEKDFYAQVQRQTSHVSKVLFGGGEGPLYFIICFTRARISPNEVGEVPPGVCSPGELAATLIGQPVVLDEDETRRLAREIEHAYGNAPEAAPPPRTER